MLTDVQVSKTTIEVLRVTDENKLMVRFCYKGTISMSHPSTLSNKVLILLGACRYA